MTKKVKIPEWPLLHFKSILSLIDVYFSKYWSWYGKYEKRFIKKFLSFHNAKYANMTISGTVALEGCLKALGIKEGDEVIVPAYTWMSTATAVLQTGATPVFVDIDKETLCISPAEIEKAITNKTKAIIPVHLFSAISDMDTILNIAKSNNLYVIEDCAHAIGAEYKNRPVGTISDAGTFSFQQSKLLSSGEGGMIVTNNLKIALYTDKLWHIGFSVYKNNPEKLIPTKNLATEFHAAILDNQCDYLKKENLLRETRAKYLENLLSDIPYIRFQKTSVGTTARSYYQFAFMIDSNKLKPESSLKNIIDDLRKQGLPADNTYGNVVYKFFKWDIPEEKYIKYDCPIAEKIVQKEIVCIPHTALITNKTNIKKIAKIIKETLKSYFIER